jgi:hypothetical protein
MRGRILASVGALGVLAAAISLAPATSAGQTRTSGSNANETGAKPKWAPPRTPDGQPDLQGVWLSRSATPLERPKALEGRPFLTDDEVKELKRRADRLFKSGNSDFAAGDGVFLSALANLEQYKNPNATHGSDEMIEREFDNRTSLVVDPSDGRIPPLTAEARRKQAAAVAAGQHPAGPEELSGALRCITWSVPRLGGRYGAGDLSYYRILQAPGYVVLYLETGHEPRIIPLDGGPHLPSSVRQWSGDSRGRWEGDTLVVDTTNFSIKSNFMGSSDGLHLVERFTRVAPDTIAYRMTFNDPTTWSSPWTAEIPLKQVREHLYEFACHEGNSQMMRGILAGARAEEKTAAQAPARK